MKKILGIGSALVDILTQIPNEQILTELNLPKGSMTYVDAQTSVEIGKKLAYLGNQMASGGSAANTMSGLAQLGVEAGFLSKIGKDEVGEFFAKQMTETHVKPLMLKSDTPSGRVQALVTADGERTFATCLGAAAEMCADDIQPELLQGWDIFYVEGYLVANPTMLRKAIETAKAQGMTEAALHYIAKRCDIAVVKIGAKGAYIQRGSETATIPPMKADVVDTTGAGDMWAAGFLAGLVKGENLQKCGMMGAIVAKNIIEVMGAKMDEARWEKIHTSIASL